MLLQVTTELRDGTVLHLEGADLDEALQYSPTRGLPRLLRHLEALQAAEHAPPVPVEVCVSTGSMDGLTKAFDMVAEAPWSGAERAVALRFDNLRATVFMHINAVGR